MPTFHSVSPFNTDHAAFPGSRPLSILFVEDDDSVRSLIVLVLRRMGHEVYEAANHEEALNLWGLHHETIDILITDLYLESRFTGEELARLLRAKHSSLPVIISSGHGQMQRALGPAEFMRLPKPYNFEELREVINASTFQGGA